VPWLLSRGPVQYDAQAQVGPTDPLTFGNLDPLPRLAESVFTNGAVAASIRHSVTPPLPPSVNVIPQQVSLITAQDNVVLVVEGHAPTPRAAARYANLAAATFTEELNKYAHSVGAFAVQKLALPPAAPVQRIGATTAAVIGVLAGLLAGLGAVVLLIAVRRPVVDAHSALQATGAQGFGRLRLVRSGHGVRGLPNLIRQLREHPVGVLLLVGPRSTRSERRMLAAELSDILGTSRMTIVEDPSQAQIAGRQDDSLVLLVVPEGISHRALSTLADQYLDGRQCGVILVRGHSRRLHASGRRSRPEGPSRPRVSAASSNGRVDKHIEVPLEK